MAEESPKPPSDDGLYVLTQNGWELCPAEFFKPLLRYEGQEYQLERMVSGEEGFLQIDLLTVDAAKRIDQKREEANKPKQ